MSKDFQANLFIIFTLCVSLQVACHSTPPVGVEWHQNSEDKNNLSQLRKQVELFAEGEGDEKIYAELQKLPRNSLISDLEKLRKQIYEDDALQVKIAFLFCRLNYHYEENSEKIAWSLARNSHYSHLPHDEVIGFASKLISLGDTQLIRVVMAASQWSDGALSEGIAVILEDAVVSDSDSFWRNLSRLTPSVRRGIYDLIKFALNPDHIETVNRNLKKRSKDKNYRKITQEMMKVLSKPV
jgi:hypothetical protein